MLKPLAVDMYQGSRNNLSTILCVKMSFFNLDKYTVCRPDFVARMYIYTCTYMYVRESLFISYCRRSLYQTMAYWGVESSNADKSALGFSYMYMEGG